MKSVVILRFSRTENPGYLITFLDEQRIPWQLIKIDEGAEPPESIAEYSGVVLMGGVMSVNDDLPWIPKVLDLIREAIKRDIPVLGHCLGGQLMSKALGGVVSKNPVKEMGWGEVAVAKNDVAKHWFGDIENFNAFHWHGETFTIPDGAMHILSSTHCHNQGFAMGKHLAFQCHPEMDAEMVQVWCQDGKKELEAFAASPAVQQPETIQENLPLHCFFLNKVAKQVYSQWIKGLVL